MANDNEDEKPLAISKVEGLSEVFDVRSFVAFLLLGLCNGFPYIVMLSAAHDIMSLGRNSTNSAEAAKELALCANGTNATEVNCTLTEGGVARLQCNSVSTGAILLADVLPAILIKAVAPQFQHHVPYRLRVAACAASAYLAFVLVSSAGKSTVQALCGVVFASLASGFGETTYLGLTTYYAPVTLSAWTCGTGTSALLASFSYALLSDLLSPRIATFCFTFVPTVTLFAFCCLLPHQPHTDLLSSPTDSTLQPLLGTEPTATAYQTSGTFDSSAHRAARSVRVSDDCESQDVNEDDLIAEQHGTLASTPVALFHQTGEQVTLQRERSTNTVDGCAKSSWSHSVPTWSERWGIVGNLRWFLVVLFWVYYLEYLTNQGLAELIIFRNTTVRPAAQYRWYQFCFRFGAFIARCSILVVHIRFVYVFPPLQLLNFLLLLAQIFVPYLPSIDFVFAIMLWEGLVGGATYGNVLKRIADECEPHFREYSLSIVTLADAAGIALAGFTAMPIHDAICTYFQTAT